MRIKVGEVWKCETCDCICSLTYDSSDTKADTVSALYERHHEIKPHCQADAGFKLLNQFTFRAPTE